jgi:hypothetical protein
MRVILVFLSVVFLWSCAKSVTQLPVNQAIDVRIQPVEKEVKLDLKSITAHDLQENITLRDELLVQIAIVRIVGETVFPESSKWVYVGSVAQGQQISLDTVQLKSAVIRPGERVGVQVSLWELDDYSKDQAFIHQLNQVSGLVQIPMR